MSYFTRTSKTRGHVQFACLSKQKRISRSPCRTPLRLFITHQDYSLKCAFMHKRYPLFTGEGACSSEAPYCSRRCSLHNATLHLLVASLNLLNTATFTVTLCLSNLIFNMVDFFVFRFYNMMRPSWDSSQYPSVILILIF